MPVSIDRNLVPNVMRLEGVVDIGCAAELQALLLEILAQSGEMEVAVAEGTEMDVTAMQLLVAAERAAQARGLRWAATWPVESHRAWRDAGFGKIPFASDAQ